MWKLDKLVFLLGFPVLASALIWFVYVGRGDWSAHLRAEVTQALKVSQLDANWAWVQVQGRTVVLTGEAPDAGTLHAVRGLILATPGVGRLIVDTRIRVWGEISPPTVELLATQAKRPQISGTWPSKAAEGLSLELAGEFYVLGETEALKVDGGKWTLTPSTDLKEGNHDVEVTAWRAELSASDGSTDEITIDRTPPPAPKVNPYFGRSLKPKLTGRWPIDQAVGLRIKVAGRTYELGKDDELRSGDDGVWTLKLSLPLATGKNEVVATAYDRVGNSQADATRAEVVVDRNPPAVPTVQRFESSRAFTLGGTWAEGDAVSLQVTVAGHVYTLGSGNELTSDGGGQWRLSPSVLPGEGTYDVAVHSRDRAGNVSKDETKNELIIRFVPERDRSEAFEETPRPLTAIMCQKAFDRILARSSVKFVSLTSELEERSLHVLDELVGAAARCPDARIEIGAHTNSVGDFSQNRRLSQLQALAVASYFVKRGIDRFRLSSVGYGEVRPIASNNTAAGRAKNQRLELYVKR